MKSPDAPASSDPYAIANAQAQANASASRLTTQQNRFDQVTPYGNMTWTNSPVLDQGGYNQAMERYNSDLANWQRQYDAVTGAGAGPSQQGGVSAVPTPVAGGSAGAMQQRAGVQGTGGSLISAPSQPDYSAIQGTTTWTPGREVLPSDQRPGTTYADPAVYGSMASHVNIRGIGPASTSSTFENLVSQPARAVADLAPPGIRSEVSDMTERGLIAAGVQDPVAPAAPQSMEDQIRRLNINKPQAPDQSQYMNQDKWTSTITLDPRLQSAVNQQMSNTQKMQDLAGILSTQASSAMLNPVTAGSLPGGAQAVNANDYATSGGIPDPNATRTGARFSGWQDITNGNPLEAGWINRGGYGDLTGGTGLTGSVRVGPAAQAGQAGDAYLDLSNLTNLPEVSERTRQAVEDALYSRAQSRLDPRFAQQQGDLNASLAAQGITQGSEAYGREQQALANERTDAYQAALANAITTGGAEQSRLFDLAMQPRQQQFAERMGQANVQTSNLNRASGVHIANMQAQNALTAQQAAIDQALALAQADNALEAGRFNRELEFKRQQENIANAMEASRYNTDLAYNTQLANNQGQMAANQQNYAQSLGANAQNFGQDLAALNARLGINGQNFNQQIAAGEYADTARQNALAEAIQLRRMPLQDLAAVNAQGQIPMPQFQAQGGGTFTGAAPIAQAMQNSQDQATAGYNQQVGTANANNAAIAKLIAAMIA